MKPEKALELVHRYSELTWAIQACRNRIAEALDKCTGLDGKRLERRRACETPPYEPWRDMEPAANEKQIHLTEWFRPDIGYDGDPTYIRIDDNQHEECPHCYAAYVAIRERKCMRIKLGAIKAAMTRTTPKPAILDWKPDYEEL